MLRYSVEEVEYQEDEHLYHPQDGARELWLDAMGVPAVLPLPEEKRHVETAIGAEKAKNARGPGGAPSPRWSGHTVAARILAP
jgi:hypothetical protein